LFFINDFTIGHAGRTTFTVAVAAAAAELDFRGRFINKDSFFVEFSFQLKSDDDWGL